MAGLACTSETSVRFHMEVLDFYDYVKPRLFEDRVRRELVRDIDRTIRQRYHDARIDAFGSFMSGLYLPTGDMDLVFCSERFLKNGMAVYNTKRHLWQLRRFLETKRVASENNFEVISKAKVPLVKYIDKLTGLKVDMSFENITGVNAIETFKAWKEQYPAMPILVTVIKHFLLMRGLNEPVNGGIGGFSVICLVTSMLQLMPQVQSGDLIPEHHLGMLLMEFFDLYGNRFNFKTVAISLNPPRYIPKSQVTGFAYKNPGRLSIIDPNNPENDISGGSSNTEKVMYYFSVAYKELQERMIKAPSAVGESILEVIMGGNYSSFRHQRDHLRKVHERLYGPCED
ncbi:putative dna polymerase sigma protein [Phaeoacremonium minimum UCRPA7]|uniref:polynucleotide adenylyltransferase n=1 Tax=Phaeoacremonium minimum (strain UCR-PA7) TaxID=1286976 RepID=R8BIS6_PHAM7|nr:putative dna polymerase sigma protein [Phaeoacremonium minimum UCRPA7]EON99225.1 putative dna polymerase sigma protein [Phaeoacremonium minimum UCRPA7]